MKQIQLAFINQVDKKMNVQSPDGGEVIKYRSISFY